MNKKLIRQFLIAMLANMLLATITYAQRGPVEGTVTNVAGQPLIGANVEVVKKSIGSVTDGEGKFRLLNVDNNDMLRVSYIGMKMLVVPVEGRSSISVVLQDDDARLDEIVVIGYGTTKKKDLTGAVGVVKGESFKDQNMQTIEQGLKGRTSGVRVISDNMPGGGISIQVRGTNSLLGGTEPLYVVDGFPLDPATDAAGGSRTAPAQSSLNFINPDDIESIEVLKDASATAIYGARGANGVVLITTKSAKSGATKVNYIGKIGRSELFREIPVLNGEEFATYMNQQELNRFYLQQQAVDLGILDAANLKPITLPFGGAMTGQGKLQPLPADMGKGTNWQQEIYSPALMHSHTMQVMGGTGKTSVALSGGYLQQNGILMNTAFKRYSLSGSIKHAVNSNFNITNKIDVSRQDAKGGAVGTGDLIANRSVVSNALWFPPIYSLDKEAPTDLDEEDEWGLNENRINNPYLLAKLLIDDKISYTLRDVLTGEYKVGKYLSMMGNFSVSKVSNKRSQYAPIASLRGRAANGQAALATSDQLKYMMEGRITYNRTFNNYHQLTALGVVSTEKKEYQDRYQELAGFPNDELTYHNTSNATTIFAPVSNEWNSRLNSVLSRLNYKFKEKYLLTASVRFDGSSRGSASSKYDVFPSLAAAWRVTQEEFMPTTKWLNDLKLRLSYGATGNEPNIPYQSLSIMRPIKYPFNDAINNGVYEQNIGNTNLGWERTDQFNAGLDISLFNSKVNLTVDAYYKLTKNLLQQVKLPPSSGYLATLMNLGTIENRGIEYNLTYKAVQTKSTSLNLTFNGSINRNKILSLGTRDYIAGDAIATIIPNRFIVGQPLGVFYGLKQTGVFKDWNQVLNSAEGVAQRDATPGEYIFANLGVDYQKDANGNFVLDANGNKTPLATQVIDVNDYTVIGDPNPKLVYGFNADLKYKQFDFSMLVTGQLGGDVYWADYGFATDNYRPFNIYRESYLNAWQAPFAYTFTDGAGVEHTIGSATGNINGTFPRANNTKTEGPTVYKDGIKRVRYRNDIMNSAMVLDGTHLKVANVSLGYNFKRIKSISQLRLSLSVTNLLLISNYPGYDPEAATFSSPMRRGIDIGSYPAQRTYSLNIQLSL